jgi:eukaryotic-like serine/threonine-protein kinase
MEAIPTFLMDLKPGAKLGPHEIVSMLGKGGMGEVWKARDPRLGRDVAIKISTQQFSDRFEREARAIASLNHPNVCTLYDVGPNYLVMELIDGTTLGEYIARGPVPVNEALGIAKQIVYALEAAHEKGIVHRDLKPANVKIRPDGSVKVLDFGLAKTGDHAEPTADSSTIMMPGISTPGMILGTVAYMSPEQAAGQAVDKRADIWAFGVVLYEILTGKRLFQNDSMAHLLADVLRGPIDLDKLPNETPRTVRHLLKRCLDRDVRNRLRDIGEARVAIDSVAPQGDDLAAPSPSRLGSSPWIAAGVVLAIGCIVAAAGWYRATRPAPETPPWALTRLTSDPGLSGSPALSPDGKMVAYSSDRSLDGAQDLYIKQVAGGEPVRLTFDGAGNTTPDFSPDGSTIVFRSNRNGGGIYEIPAFSGDARLLVRDGLNPKYSPDGSQVAYWVGEQGVSARVPGGGTVWVVPAAGGQPQKVGPNFTAARYPIWSLDGKRLLFVGYTSAKAGEASGLDWWLVAPNGGDAVKTGAQDALLRGALPVGATVAAIVQIEHKPGCWSAGNNVVLSKLNGDTSNLLEIGISPRTGKVIEAPKNLTTGAGNEVEPACTPVGALAFTNVETRGDIWSLPFDMDHGTAKGVLERITQGPAFREGPSLSNDGRNVAFASNQSGLGNIWARDLATGKESSVARSAFRQRFPVSNASGDRIAFSVYEKEKRAVYLSTPGGTPEKLCEGCLRATAWSRDEKTLLIFGGNPYQVNLLDIATHRQTPLLKHPAWALLYGRYSPDNRWVSFTARTESNHGRVAIAPIDGPKPVPESAWITIAEEGPEDFANWSPDGKTLYFTSARDGHYCLWGQRIDPGSHQPVGEAFAAEHLHGRLSYQQGGWSVSSGGIALGLTEQTGNIWTMTRSSAR